MFERAWLYLRVPITWLLAILTGKCPVVLICAQLRLFVHLLRACACALLHLAASDRV